eukprot:11160532-Alexandrium_andersonii.AAC.1
MSASLVGSEMCIRDRTVKLPGGVTSSLQVSGEGWREAPSLSRHRGGSVSYTHLTLPTICSV